jgi:uncharacterized protein YjaZ
MNLHLLKASGRLTSFQDQITSAFNEVAEKIDGKIILPAVDVVIVDYPEKVIPETGVGGYAMGPHLLYVYIDPESPHFLAHATKEIVSTLTHELHHCARMSALGQTKTLIEGFVFEGLADHFDIEINNFAPFPWSVALTNDQLTEQLQKAIPKFNNGNYDHQAWFFGSEEKGIPRWTGYSLGFEIVGKYMQKSGKTAAELFDVPANYLLSKDKMR